MKYHVQNQVRDAVNKLAAQYPYDLHEIVDQLRKSADVLEDAAKYLPKKGGAS